MINANVSALLSACSKVCLISVSLSIIIKLDHFAFLCFSVLKGYTIQHLPDGTVIVESIVIKVSSSAEDSNTKVLLLSWSYQVKTHGHYFWSVSLLFILLNALNSNKIEN